MDLALPTKRILLVEDEPGFREVLQIGLEPRGFRTEGLGSLAEAKGRLETERFVWALVVVHVPEVIEDALLGACVLGGLAHELGQRPVEALEAAVLLWLARLTEFRQDPQP